MAPWRPYPGLPLSVTRVGALAGVWLGVFGWQCWGRRRWAKRVGHRPQGRTGPLLRVDVGGLSMAPALRPGDRVVAVRGLPLRPGDVVAAADPRRCSRLLVKRVVAVGGDGSVEVAGDNPAASTDSRVFGPLPARLVFGRVVWRYWPRHRRGRVDAAPLGRGDFR